MESPETCYAWNGNVALAYQVIGEGPIDLLYLQGACAHGWEKRIGTPTSRAGYFLGEESLLDGTEQRWFRRYLRASVGPGAHVAEIRRYLDTDIRAVLSSVHVPTLILQDTDGTNLSSPEAGRYLRDHIPGARLVELAGNDRHHWYWGSESIAASVGVFLAEVRDEEADFDRVLATVLFTDIVSSTEMAAEIGDRRWRELVHSHHASVRALLARYRGRRWTP